MREVDQFQSSDGLQGIWIFFPTNDESDLSVNENHHFSPVYPL